MFQFITNWPQLLAGVSSPIEREETTVERIYTRVMHCFHSKYNNCSEIIQQKTRLAFSGNVKPYDICLKHFADKRELSYKQRQAFNNAEQLSISLLYHLFQ